jgi:hypothetical protein
VSAAAQIDRTSEADWRRENAHRLDVAAQRLATVLEAGLAREEAVFDTDGVVPPALQQLAQRFSLGLFERDLLLVTALIERHPALTRLIVSWRGDPQQTHMGYDLAAWLLPGSDRLALSPSAALRRWRLIDVPAGQSPARARLTIDERVQFYLEGHSFVDTRLDGLVRPLTGPPHDEPALLRRVGAALRGALSPAHCPLIAVSGANAQHRAGFVVAAGEALRTRVFTMPASAIPPQPAEREALARLWEREAMLLDAALLIECDELRDDVAVRLRALLQSLEALVFVASPLRLMPLARPVLRCELPEREAHQEIARWKEALGRLAQHLNGSVERAAIQFRLDDQGLRDAAAAALAAPTAEAAGEALWDSARMQARRGLDALAERIETHAVWDDLVLPAPQLESLRGITMHVRERHRVYREWGFATKSGRGLGIAALFAGGSGTGKTLAAEVLAHELRLDLYRIDLARLVSKYIGETEKHLAQVFDAAEACGAIVLFDEADALFGKRSEVRDSHDRYANIEVSYLLQRIETYHGLSILTTNLKQALDPAFVRRIRFIVQFPFPDGAARQEIWAHVFPDAMPREALDFAKLARLNITGGHIRNIALNAAFLAASRDEPVRMTHLRNATEAEYAKLEKPLARAEIGDWA